jgi:hypothetical protein
LSCHNEGLKLPALGSLQLKVQLFSGRKGMGRALIFHIGVENKTGLNARVNLPA